MIASCCDVLSYNEEGEYFTKSEWHIQVTYSTRKSASTFRRRHRSSFSPLTDIHEVIFGSCPRSFVKMISLLLGINSQLQHRFSSRISPFLVHVLTPPRSRFLLMNVHECLLQRKKKKNDSPHSIKSINIRIILATTWYCELFPPD